MAERYLVTAALPYASGPRHIGHAAGVYIPADIYARYHRMKGHDVVFICGTDEHGTPITVQAAQEGVRPIDIADRYHKVIKDSFDKLGFSFDNFSRTTREIHYRLAQDFFTTLYKKGYIYEKEVELLYCSNCKRFLPDRYVEGVCPHCGAEAARGDQCDACGRILNPTDLVNPHCVICNTAPTTRKSLQWFFKLSAFEDAIKKMLEENRHWPDNVRNFCLQLIEKEGLKDRDITRDLEWGIPVPLPEAKGKVLYVWFDAPIGYISATMEWAQKIGDPQKWREYWQGNAKIVHFLAKDNIPFHAIIWPAMLMAYGGFNLPWMIPAYEHLNLEGRKMSTSRGWVVELNDFLDEFDPDMLRYYLTINAPQKRDVDFYWREFQRRVNDELADIIGNFIHRTLSFIYNNFDGKVPAPGEFDEQDKEMLRSIENARVMVGKHIEEFNSSLGLKEIVRLARSANKYFNDKQPWRALKEDPQKCATTLYVCAQLTRSLAIMLAPYLPFTSQRLWRMLNLPADVHKQSWDSAAELGIKPGHKIRKPEPLFIKLQDGAIRKREEKLQAILRAQSPTVVTAEEFAKLDIRIGKVVSVEPIPRSKKLLKLSVDVGGERRTIVAGLAQHYSPEQLAGKNVVVLLNLKPAQLMGVTSEGMLLAAEDEKGPSILTPDRPVKPGSRVK